MNVYSRVDAMFEIASGRSPTKHVEIEDDIGVYDLQPQQNFLPHVVTDPQHPAKIGDMVTIHRQSILHGFGVSTVFISGVRSFKRYRQEYPVHQVEILGVPCRWFRVDHFKEYQYTGPSKVVPRTNVLPFPYPPTNNIKSGFGSSLVDPITETTLNHETIIATLIEDCGGRPNSTRVYPAMEKLGLL
jgi:hypothetical protein